MRTPLVLAVACAGCNTIVLSEYGTPLAIHRAEDGAARRRSERNRGVDFRADEKGDAVLAAADGVVLRTESDPCAGIRVTIRHPDFDRVTVYANLQETFVQTGDLVGRGQAIGEVGLLPCSDGIVHVHMELWLYGPELHAARRRDLGELAGTLDPLAYSAGCFDRGRTYSGFVLTYPVDC